MSDTEPVPSGLDTTAVIPVVTGEADATDVIPVVVDATAEIPAVVDAVPVPEPAAPAEAAAPDGNTPRLDGNAPRLDGDTQVLDGDTHVLVLPRDLRSKEAPPEEPLPAPAGRRWRFDLVPGPRTRVVMRTAGEVMITFGLILLLFAAYEIWGKAAIVNKHQSALDAELDAAWGNPVVGPSGPGSGPIPGASGQADPGPPPPPPGGSLGRLYLPKLGMHWVVVEGVTDSDLAFAPGHYPQTALPGQVGNFSVAGHRSPAIFWDLDRMRVGDNVVMETRDTFYVYRVTRTHIVAPTAVEVIAAVPGDLGATATEAMLTITTCNPKWDNYERLILHAELVRTQPRSQGRPAELNGQ